MMPLPPLTATLLSAAVAIIVNLVDLTLYFAAMQSSIPREAIVVKQRLQISRIVSWNIQNKSVTEIKTAIYAVANAILVLFCLRSMKQARSILSELNQLPRLNMVLVFGMLLGFVLMGFKFLPDFCCKNLTISFNNSLLLAGHIFFTNLWLMFHTRKFNQELRSFGALLERSWWRLDCVSG